MFSFKMQERKGIVMALQEGPKNPPSDELEPTQEQIASLAYALWQRRGCPEGSPQQDWLRAEEALLARSDW